MPVLNRVFKTLNVRRIDESVVRVTLKGPWVWLLPMGKPSGLEPLSKDEFDNLVAEGPEDRADLDRIVLEDLIDYEDVPEGEDSGLGICLGHIGCERIWLGDKLLFYPAHQGEMKGGD